MLKPQDIVILLQVHCLGTTWTYSELAKSLKMSASTVHEALQRCELSHLYNQNKRRILKGALEEFLVHGLKYAFPAEAGAIIRGIPTAHSAEPLKKLLMIEEKNPYVWASAKGKIKGQAIMPLYKSVPKVVENQENAQLYELLCLVDSLRAGKIREQELAALELSKRLYA
ncbi:MULTISPECIES: hypothetical protein [Cyanophyceae]|uniref:hypothetical protein n=1 Tax=Cyanophyceae TaxID=3028117 RepID=UPI00016DCF1A|nr:MULTISPECIES: hypothetical protein [Cyanophyceae]ACB01012.1 conserved hypothetical protein [Picosynechococcus sp. PCC 7002]SMH58371.1 hypothetical protein SAMN06272755_3151 [Picosynechococcus sp. OG1]SMQ86400.1 hypothetical protein SAMN06272774_3142 [Synechococcus sp. 7002]